MISLIGSISVPSVLLSITVQSVNKCFLYLCRKKLSPGEIWTHTVRAGEGTTIIRVLFNLPSTLTLVTSLLEVAAEWREKTWQDSYMETLRAGGLWTHAHWIPRKLRYIMRNYASTKYTKFHVATAEHRVPDPGKVLKYTLTNTETGWDLNPHPSDNLDVPLLYA